MLLFLVPFVRAEVPVGAAVAPTAAAAASVAEPWELATARAVGTPAAAAARLAALRAAQAGVVDDDERSFQLRSVLPVLAELDDALGLPSDARVAVVAAA